MHLIFHGWLIKKQQTKRKRKFYTCKVTHVKSRVGTTASKQIAHVEYMSKCIFLLQCTDLNDLISLVASQSQLTYICKVMRPKFKDF